MTAEVDTAKDMRKTVVSAYRRGKSVRAIAGVLGLGDTTVMSVLRDEGIMVEDRISPLTDVERNKTIVELRDAGFSLKAIGDKFDMTPQRVHFIVARGY